jgi:hypothetical protein
VARQPKDYSACCARQQYLPGRNRKGSAVHSVLEAQTTEGGHKCVGGYVRVWWWCWSWCAGASVAARRTSPAGVIGTSDQTKTWNVHVAIHSYRERSALVTPHPSPARALLCSALLCSALLRSSPHLGTRLAGCSSALGKLGKQSAVLPEVLATFAVKHLWRIFRVEQGSFVCDSEPAQLNLPLPSHHLGSTLSH